MQKSSFSLGHSIPVRSSSKKMKLLQLTVIFLPLLILHGHAQTVTDCSQLGFQTGAPFTGNFPLCGDLGGNQCCSASYLTMTAEMEAERGLKEDLREELEDGDREYRIINTFLTQYIFSGFLNGIANSFPFADRFDANTLSDLYSYLSSNFAPNLYLNATGDDFDSEGYVNLIVDQFITVATNNLFNSSDQLQLGCINRAIRSSINSTIKTQLARGIQSIRRSATALARIQNFMVSYRSTLVSDFTPIEDCTKRLARLSFCGRCSRRIPPLCRGTCNALVRGCLSPVYSALRRDFGQLWNVSKDIISHLEGTISEFFVQQRQIISYVDLVNQLERVCVVQDLPVPGTPEPSTQQSEDDDWRRTFNTLRGRLDNFDGPFEYGEDGPRFCEPASTERAYCMNDQRDSNADRGCEMNQICTSACRCWDGNQMRETNTADYTRNGVLEQEDNPQVTGLTGALVAQANTMGANTPANDFLNSTEFRALVPEGIQIPPAEPFRADSGAVMGVVSLVAMVITTLISLAL